MLGLDREGDGGADYGDRDGYVRGPAEGYEVCFYGWGWGDAIGGVEGWVDDAGGGGGGGLVGILVLVLRVHDVRRRRRQRSRR